MSRPNLRSVEDLESISEDTDTQTGEVRYTTFELFHDGHGYFGQIFKPKNSIMLAEYNEALKMVPDEEIYPELPEGSNLTIATQARSSYFKRPNLSIYELVKGTPFLADILLHEAQIMQQISEAPHPNIVGYHGIVIKYGRITALALDRHERNLLTHLKRGGRVDAEKLTQALVSAVAHLHSLNLAHNDINPENIMIDNAGNPILIDFGSCQTPGKRVLSAGTPGWTYEQFTHSSKDHDLYALGKLSVWLLHQTRVEAWGL